MVLYHTTTKCLRRKKTVKFFWNPVKSDMSSVNVKNSLVKSLFSRYQRHTVMFNWSPCTSKSMSRGGKRWESSSIFLTASMSGFERAETFIIGILSSVADRDVYFFFKRKYKGKKVEKRGKREHFPCTWGEYIIFEKGGGKNILFWANIHPWLRIQIRS